MLYGAVSSNLKSYDEALDAYMQCLEIRRDILYMDESKYSGIF